MHVSTPLPLHCVLEGAHTPWQVPFEQAWFTHAVAGSQCPPTLHVCAALPVHFVCPGVHAQLSAGLAPKQVAFALQTGFDSSFAGHRVVAALA